MKQYDCQFRVDGKSAVQRICAGNSIEVQKLIEKMYPNSKITCFKCKEIKEEKK